MEFDFFISHAHDDKDLVARPLAHTLRAAGCDVWYDEFTLRVGDSLLASIDHGLGTSRYGVVVLSPSFFSRQWPRNELAGLVATEREHARRVLPVWHHVNARDVASYSPVLADRLAASTNEGLYRVCERLIEATFPERMSQLPLSPDRSMNESDLASARNALSQLLTGDPTREDVFLLLSVYHSLLEHIGAYSPIVLPGYKLGGLDAPEFVIVEQHGITGPICMRLVYLGSVEGDVDVLSLATRIKQSFGGAVEYFEQPENSYLGPPYVGQYPQVLAMADAAIALLDPKGQVDDWNVHFRTPGVWSVEVVIVAGRRYARVEERRREAASVIPCPVDVMSYERLIDIPA